MNKLIGWLLFAVAVLIIIAKFVSSNALWPIVNILEGSICVVAGAILLSNKIVGWLLIAVPILVIIGLLVQNDTLWIVFDICIVMISFVGGFVFLQKNA